jgi:hypothetical protein
MNETSPSQNPYAAPPMDVSSYTGTDKAATGITETTIRMPSRVQAPER